MTQQDVEDEFKLQGGINSKYIVDISARWSNSISAQVGSMDRHIPKINYVVNKFRGSVVDVEIGKLPSKVRSLTRAFNKKIASAEQDYDNILKFIDDNITFKYEDVRIIGNSVTFGFNHMTPSIATMNFTIDSKTREISIVSNMASRHFYVGENFNNLFKQEPVKTKDHE